jgi:hypothetical protein
MTIANKNQQFLLSQFKNHNNCTRLVPIKQDCKSTSTIIGNRTVESLDKVQRLPVDGVQMTVLLKVMQESSHLHSSPTHT